MSSSQPTPSLGPQEGGLALAPEHQQIEQLKLVTCSLYVLPGHDLMLP